LDSVKAGTEHLARYLDFFKLPEHPVSAGDGYYEPRLILKQINDKTSKIFKVVKNDPDYYPEIFKQNADRIEEYFQAREPTQTQGGLVQKNSRILLSNIPIGIMHADDDELSDMDLDE
jgi:hypothetical protein